MQMSNEMPRPNGRPWLRVVGRLLTATLLLAVPAVAVSFADFGPFSAPTVSASTSASAAPTQAVADTEVAMETVLENWDYTTTKAQQALAAAQFKRIQTLIAAITNNSQGIIKQNLRLKADLAAQKKKNTSSLKASIRFEVTEMNRLTIQMKKYINELSNLTSPFQAKPAFVAPTVTIFAFAGR